MLSVDLADVSELKKARAFALGCPSMGAEQLEETQMELFMCDLENGIGGKPVSYTHLDVYKRQALSGAVYHFPVGISPFDAHVPDHIYCRSHCI